jgi:hypothetical protein
MVCGISHMWSKGTPTVGPDAFFDRAVLDYTHPVPCELC